MKSKTNWILKNLHLLLSLSIVVPTAIIYGSPSILPEYFDIQVFAYKGDDIIFSTFAPCN